MENFKEEFIRQFMALAVYYCPTISLDVARFIACQFALESDFGDSPVAIDNHNFGGMKIPSYRISAGCSRHDNSHPVYLQFADARSFMIDYFYRCAWYHFDLRSLKNLDDFKRELCNSGYCPEKSYISRIESIYNQFINLTI